MESHPHGVGEGVWWDLKDVKRRLEKGRGLVPRDLAKRRNPLVQTRASP